MIDGAEDSLLKKKGHACPHHAEVEKEKGSDSHSHLHSSEQLNGFDRRSRSVLMSESDGNFMFMDDLEETDVFNNKKTRLYLKNKIKQNRILKIKL